MRSLVLALIVAQQITPQSCGSSTSSTTTQNTQPLVVNAGPANSYLNGLFTSVTICAPGQSSSCQTIAGILVDTGSSGLRVLSSALTLSLPQQNTSSGTPVVECFQFLDGYTWGPVETADVRLAGETASSVPIQVIGGGGFSNVPASCSSTGTAENTLDTLQANGVLGVGLFRQDCGGACTVTGSSNPGLYYACASSGCQPTAEPLTQQLQNPVWLLSRDNNGVGITLQQVASGGAALVTGSLVLGIGTASNNALGSARVFTTDGSGNFFTLFGGRSYDSTFIDSGSNAYFFLDTATTGLPVCGDTADFYCPTTVQTLSATHRGINGTTATFSFNVGNADPELAATAFSAFGDIAGPQPGTFDWGLPFFFGRTVYTAIEGQSTPGGTGPFWAY